MQAVNPTFHQIAAGEVIPLAWGLRVAFAKAKREDLSWFTLDQSTLNGDHVLSPTGSNPLQLWDSYRYDGYDDRVVSMEWERSLEFPYFVQSALADVVVDNHDGLFTPQGSSPLSEHLIPKRPIRLLAGYGGGVGAIPQFIGLTQEMPEVDDGNRTVTFHSMDFLGEIFEMPLTQTIAMRDVTTDEVLDSIFKQFGMAEWQYELEPAINQIPFVFFERNTNAGDAIRQLMQAEMGRLWLDEQGIICFSSRVSTDTDPVMTFGKHNTIRISATGYSEMINRIRIITPIREVQEFQTIHRKESSGDSTSNLWVVPSDGSLTMSLSLEDPCYSAVAPTLGFASNVSWFTAKTSNGDPVTSLVTATGELRTNSYEVTFANNNMFPVEIDELELWGEPAKQIDEMDYEARSANYDKENDSLLEILDNSFLQDYNAARSFAMKVFDEYSYHQPIVEMEIKGNLALQLDDIIEITHKYPGQYRINNITTKLSDGGLNMVIKARKFTPKSWFVLNQSELDGTDILSY